MGSRGTQWERVSLIFPGFFIPSAVVFIFWFLSSLVALACTGGNEITNVANICFHVVNKKELARDIFGDISWNFSLIHPPSPTTSWRQNLIIQPKSKRRSYISWDYFRDRISRNRTANLLCWEACYFWQWEETPWSSLLYYHSVPDTVQNQAFNSCTPARNVVLHVEL